MRIHEALPREFLAKEDFEPEVVCEVDHLEERKLLDPGTGEHKKKPVLFFKKPSGELDTKRGIVLNRTNFKALTSITGHEDSDAWTGARICVFHDPNVEMRGERVGGVRIRRAPEPVLAGTEAEPPF